MKIAKIDFKETLFISECPINDTYLVCYENDKEFAEKIEALRCFRNLVCKYDFEDKGDKEAQRVWEANKGILEKYWNGSHIASINDYICDVFKLVNVEQYIEFTW